MPQEHFLNKTDIKKAIIEVVAFFDLFDYPLTAFEIWRYLMLKCSFSDVLVALKNISHLDCSKGFYYLLGRSFVIEARLEKYNYADRKFKRALRIMKIFKFIPWIKFAAVCNVIGAHNLKDKGDIDLFIVTDHNRVWITRFFCVIISIVLRLRPQPKNTKDKICLSFFVSDQKINLRDFIIPDLKLDINYIYWLAGFVPLYGEEEFYKEFLKTNNWIYNYLPNWWPPAINYRRFLVSPRFKAYKALIDFMLGRGEKIFKLISLIMMNPKLRELKNKDTRVVINDKVLKLHANDGRKEYFEKWRAKLASLN